jgi:tRNA dimethylallyltransferase
MAQILKISENRKRETQNVASLQDGIIIDGIVHYGFDLCSITDDFSAGMFRDYFNEKSKLILAKGKNVILTGGTGLYIDVCMKGLANIPEIPTDIKNKVNDLISTEGLSVALKLLRGKDKITQLDEKNPRRIARALEVVLATNIPLGEWQAKTNKNTEYDFKIFGLKLDREILYQRINERVLKMIADGMIDEAKFLKGLDLSDSDIKKAGIGYNHLIKFLNNEISIEKAIEQIQQDTRNYAKRQITWFNRYENVEWVEANDLS